MSFERASGVLLHITSLPSVGGIGDLGPAAYAFVDFLSDAGQGWWQVLPLAPTGYGNSPYAALSAFSSNPLLLSLEKLAEWGWIDANRLAALPTQVDFVDFEQVAAQKTPLLEEAARNFLALRPHGLWERFVHFRQANDHWLADWALYSVLRRKYDYRCWHDWPHALAAREPEALREAREQFAAEIAVEEALQFAFDEQWQELRGYAAGRGVRIMGDLAIFVNYDSAEVWAHPEIFLLDQKLAPVRVAGVPPDYFSETGQRWGNPVYRWDVLEEQGFGWWIERVRRCCSLYDAIRLDHFRGYEAYWSIPAEEQTAVKGEWVKAPGEALFHALRHALGELPFLAEDLGVITPEVVALREQFHLPSMRVMQFGFAASEGHHHLPHAYVPAITAYTGTHDNDTTRGWWEQGATAEERASLKVYLGAESLGVEDGGVVWAMIRSLMTSVAQLCLFPAQDLLNLGSGARMNTPARPSGNWSWRCPPEAWHPELAKSLAALVTVSDRLPKLSGLPLDGPSPDSIVLPQQK